MASRFYANNASSESGSESDSEQVQQVKKPTRQFNFNELSSDDESDNKGKFVSKKDKMKFENLRSVSKDLTQKLNIQDFNNGFDLFVQLTEEIEKSKKMLESEENDNALPTCVLEVLYKLNDTVESAWPNRKKLKKNESTALTKLKTRFKKYKDEKDEYADQIENYEPAAEPEPESSSESSEEDSDVAETTAKPAPTTTVGFLKDAQKKKVGKITKMTKFIVEDSGDESSEESSDEESSSEESSSEGESSSEESSSEESSDSESDSESESSSEASDSDSDDSMWADDDSDSSDDDGEGAQDLVFGSWRMFLKEEIDQEKAEELRMQRIQEAKDKERKKQEERIRRKVLQEEGEADDQDGGWETKTTKAPVSGGKAYAGAEYISENEIRVFSADILKAMAIASEKDITERHVTDKFRELLDMRGKKNYNKRSTKLCLDDLCRLAAENKYNPSIELNLRLAKVSTLMEFSDSFKKTLKAQWQDILDEVETMLNLAKANPQIRVDVLLGDEEENMLNPDQPYALRNSIVGAIENIDLEYIKILQNTDQQSTEYVEVLGHENSIIKIIRSLCEYQKTILDNFEKNQDSKTNRERHVYLKEQTCKAYILFIKHTHYKYDTTGQSFIELTPMYNFIYKYDPYNYIKLQTVLYQSYHLALHDQIQDARDLFNMTHLTQYIDNAPDIEVKILYNRALAQLGLAFFRSGSMNQAVNCLAEIMATGRAKELLAQGLMNTFNKNIERSPEEEAIQRRRLFPFHLHINLELLECSYIVSAMLTEIPSLAQTEFSGKKNLRISKYFYNLLRQNERNPSLTTSPDHYKDILMAASKSLKLGDWRSCVDLVCNEKLSKTIWSRFNNSDLVTQMITEKIKIQSLRCYLFTYSQFYTNVSNEWLSENFELERKDVAKIVTKMMVEDNLQASWDGPTESVVLHGTEPTRLQNIALQLSQKVAAIQEHNEKIAGGEKGMTMLGRIDRSNYDNKNKNNDKFRSKNKNNNDGEGDGKSNYKGKNNKNYKNSNNQNNNRNKNYNNNQKVRFDE